MKLNEELKAKIELYFDGISAEELYEISVNRYGFTEETSIERDMLDLELLKKQMDVALQQETSETMSSWLNKQRLKKFISTSGEDDHLQKPKKVLVSQRH